MPGNKEGTAPDNFMGKRYSPKLDCNISISRINSNSEIIAIGAVLFATDGKTQIDAFFIEYSVLPLTEHIFDSVEEAYMELLAVDAARSKETNSHQ